MTCGEAVRRELETGEGESGASSFPGRSEGSSLGCEASLRWRERWEKEVISKSLTMGRGKVREGRVPGCAGGGEDFSDVAVWSISGKRVGSPQQVDGSLAGSVFVGLCEGFCCCSMARSNQGNPKLLLALARGGFW